MSVFDVCFLFGATCSCVLQRTCREFLCSHGSSRDRFGDTQVLIFLGGVIPFPSYRAERPQAWWLSNSGQLEEDEADEEEVWWA